MDKDKKWPVSVELQETADCPSTASYNDFLNLGYTDGPDHTGLLDPSDSAIVFLYGGKWQVVGTNGF